MAGMLMHQNLQTYPGNVSAEAVHLVTNGQGNLSDLMLVNNYKGLGLADSTMKLIEDDLSKSGGQPLEKPTDTQK